MRNIWPARKFVQQIWLTALSSQRGRTVLHLRLILNNDIRFVFMPKRNSQICLINTNACTPCIARNASSNVPQIPSLRYATCRKRKLAKSWSRYLTNATVIWNQLGDGFGEDQTILGKLIKNGFITDIFKF